MKYYRFRSIERLLGESQELRRQTIYFAAPGELNDPMEGVRDIFWDGDIVVWKNLFRHYLFCLERMCSLLLICGEEYHSITPDDLPVFGSVEELPTPEYRTWFAEMVDEFFGEQALQQLIEAVARRSTPIRQSELSFYLRTIHWYAVEVINVVYERRGLIPAVPDSLDGAEQLRHTVEQDFVGCIENLIVEHGEAASLHNIVEAVLSANQHITLQVELIVRFNGRRDASTPNRDLVLLDFPETYLHQIEKLVYPPWYTACFMSSCSNSSAWGHYADGHKGACLIFDPEKRDGGNLLRLNGIVGGQASKRRDGSVETSSVYGDIPLKFQPVEYGGRSEGIDFFRSLGRLTIGGLKSIWYTDGGAISCCAQDIFENEEVWREQYWKKFEPDLLKKTDDWAYENEYRLLLVSSLDNFSTSHDRALTYDFGSLKGIIFGINTPKDKKLEIMQIVADKCRQENREGFELHQAYFDPRTGAVRHAPLGLLNGRPTD